MLNLRAIGVLVAMGAAATGCGDGPICQSEVLVLIQAPQSLVLEDTNDEMDGVQTSVRVRSTLNAEVDVELVVLDADGEEVFTATEATDDDGDVEFEDVTMPSGAATLRVSADAGECGSDEDEVVLDVAAGRGCELEVREGPIDNDFYEPRGVLNLSNDDNPAMPNFQAHVDVTTLPGYDVELFVIGDSGDETSAGTEGADDEGAAGFAISLAQGRVSLRAVCTDTSGILVSPSITTSVFVDTESPDCAMTNPPGATLSTAMDDDSDTSNGIQLTLTAHADGGDLEGEPATFVVTANAMVTTLPGTDFDVAGDTSADASIDVTLFPDNVMIQLSARDHAGNGCDETVDYDVVYVCQGRGFGEIGGTCDSNDDCGTVDSACYFGAQGSVAFPPEGYCMEDDFTFSGGVYTSPPCAIDSDCPTGTVCTEWVDYGGYKSCMPSCSCVGGDACPDNQACLDSFNGTAGRLDRDVCVPGNSEAVDGDVCDGFFDCDEFTTCFDDFEYPNGECQRYECTLGNDSTCNGGHCVSLESPFTGTTCVDTCTIQSDCRTADGYVCFDPDGAGTATNFCRHPHVGDACTSLASCGGAPMVCKIGGTFVGGYCSVDSCPTPGSRLGCSVGSACYDDPLGATNFCVDRCAGIGTQSTCRTGYLCTDTDPGGPVTGGCTPL